MDRRNTENYHRQKLSVAICFIMDNVGYSDEMRRFRIQEYDKLAKQMNKDCPANGLFFCNTGSKAEGLSLPFQGDMDSMHVLNDSVCVDEPSVSGDFNILRAEYNDMSPPGYVHVSAFQLTNSSLAYTSGYFIANSIVYTCTNDSGQTLVSSSIFRNFFNQILSSLSTITSNIDFIHDDSTAFNGPAFTKTFSYKSLLSDHVSELPSFDFVTALFFYTSKYLDHWKQRPRYHNWPSSAVLEDIAQSEGYIVPCGSAESNLPDLEWRVSYVTAEQKLMRSLNPTQAKLFVVLKMISKELLGSEGSGISSYVMKNVVLWVCELYGKDIFVPELLLDQIATALLFLKQCLQNNRVPNYIIPDRNLIAGRLNVQSKTNLICRLSDLIENRSNIFYELNIFRKHFPILCMSTSCIHSYGKKRDEIEKIWLLEIAIDESVSKPEFSSISSVKTDILYESFDDERCLEISLRLLDLIVPEWERLAITNPGDIIKIYMERLQAYLS